MKKLKRRLIYTVTLSLFLVFSILTASLYIVLSWYVSNRSDAMTELICNNGGVMPRFQEYRKFEKELLDELLYFDEETAFKARYFVIHFDSNKEIIDINLSHIAAVDSETANKMIHKAFSKGNTTGYINEYRYRISSLSGNDNTAVFLDVGNEIFAVRIAIAGMVAVTLILTIFVLLLFAFLSNKVLRPFEENNRMQKQFITNASHELKTPLSVIRITSELLTYKNSENNAYISNIKNQIDRMSGLIDELLTLSKMEEFDGELFIEEINLSNLVEEQLESFNEVFSGKEVKVISKIQPDIILNANIQQITMLISILIENASKYVNSPGTVEVSLSSSMRFTTFKIYNTAELPADLDCKKLFERFYRPDSSRNQSTGGHGLGLSIAHKIVTLHKGTITAKKKDNGIIFTAEISNSLKKKTNKKTKEKSKKITVKKSAE